MQNFIVNIDSTKKYFVNSVNQRMISNKCVIDCAETEQFKFSFVDKCGTPVELKENMQYYLAVSKERNNAGTILIFDDNPVIDGNSIIFNLNSKTEEYLSIIKNKTECWIEIGEKQLGADNYNILLQDNCICLPKVYVIGVPTELESYYTKTESDALFATKEQLNNDYYTKTESDNKLSEKADLSSLVDYQPISGMNVYALKDDIPTKVSQLTNDSGFISSYTETDPIFTSISATLATKAELPTKVSELINDSGFISSYTETDPIFTSISATLATKTYVNEAIPDISAMINVEGNNLNVGGVLNEDGTPKFAEVDIRGTLVKVLGSGMKVYDTVAGNEILSTTSDDFKYKTEYDVERMKKASTANFNFEPYTYLTLTAPITSINYNLPEGTLKNAILQFTTGDSIEFTIIGSSSYKINKPFAFEPNTSYIIYVDDYDIFWCKLHNFNQ